MDTLTAKGVNGQLELQGDILTIRRKGFMALSTQGLKGDKQIEVKSITSVQFKGVGRLTNGYIQFAFMGGSEAKGGLFQGVQDENTVAFKKDQQQAFEAIRDGINQRRSQPNGQAQTSAADELTKLAQLKEAGHLTQAEFDTKKRQLLGL